MIAKMIWDAREEAEYVDMRNLRNAEKKERGDCQSDSLDASSPI
jgi:hypothetical protein